MENVYINKMEPSHTIELIAEFGTPLVRYHTYFCDPKEAVLSMAYLEPGCKWRLLSLPPQRETGG